MGTSSKSNTHADLHGRTGILRIALRCLNLEAGRRLDRILASRRLSTADVTLATGISQAALKKFLAGERDLSVTRTTDIARLLEVPTAHLIGGWVSPPSIRTGIDYARVLRTSDQRVGARVDHVLFLQRRRANALGESLGWDARTTSQKLRGRAPIGATELAAVSILTMTPAKNFLDPQNDCLLILPHDVG